MQKNTCKFFPQFYVHIHVELYTRFSYIYVVEKKQSLLNIFSNSYVKKIGYGFEVICAIM